MCTCGSSADWTIARSATPGTVASTRRTSSAARRIAPRASPNSLIAIWPFLPEMFSWMLNGQIAIKLFGDDLGAMRRAAEDVRRVLATVPGVADLAIVQSAELPQVHIVVDRQAIARYGLNVADVQEVVETAIGGATATSLWEGERHFDVVVRLAEAARATLDRLEVAPGQASITRYANMRFVGVRLNVHGRDMGSLVAEAQRRVAAEVKLPPNSFLTWGGEFENQRRAMTRLAIIIPVSIALILAILFRTFGSLRCALLILATIPFR